MSVRVLTINGGSSTLKFAVFEMSEAGKGVDPPQRAVSGSIDRIGAMGSRLRAKGPWLGEPVEEEILAPDARSAAERMIAWLDGRGGLAGIAAVGHRVVHGGGRHGASERVTPALVAELRALSPLDPDHMPGGIALLEAVQRRLPDVPQVACFDTAFHHGMPEVARRLPIPRRYDAMGLRRYGFHGLSYAYLLEELARLAGEEAARGRLVLAHLGSGASLAAVVGRECRDTTMALTPASGLVMGTRSGDLDPGLLVHLVRAEGLDADALDALVNRRSGLLGVSESSADMRDLLAREKDDARAADAVALFCYTVKKGIGAYAAVLGGLDTLVFSGGIGENAPEVRRRVCEGLGFLGLTLDEVRNAAPSTPRATVISQEGSRVCVRVIPTDEESMIANELRRVLKA
jgi:acetate kinase